MARFDWMKGLDRSDHERQDPDIDALATDASHVPVAAGLTWPRPEEMSTEEKVLSNTQRGAKCTRT